MSYQKFECADLLSNIQYYNREDDNIGLDDYTCSIKILEDNLFDISNYSLVVNYYQDYRGTNDDARCYGFNSQDCEMVSSSYGSSYMICFISIKISKN